MAAGTWTPVNGFRTALASGAYDLTAASTYKVALVASSSNISGASTTFAGVTGELSTANGYTAGGLAVTMSLTGTTSVAVYFNASPGNPIWTATGGSITARWAVLYKISGNVLSYVLLDSTPADVTATPGNTLAIDSDNSPSPVITIA